MTLIERLESAEQGSRELDAEMYLRFGWSGNGPDSDALDASAEWLEFHGWNVTTDLSAAVALVERVLPGWGWEICTGRRCPGEDCYWAKIRTTKAHSLSAPLALCTALLKALKTKEPSA